MIPAHLETVWAGLEEGSDMDDGHDEAMKAEWMERVVQAATLANAHSFIMDMPQQYDTEVRTSTRM